MPGTADTAIISTHTVTVNITTAVTSITISSSNSSGNSLLVQLTTATLTVSGNLNINQPAITNTTNGWALNGGSATVSGSIIFFATSSIGGTLRVSSITITTGQLYVSTIVVLGTAPANAVLKMNGGGGTINLLSGFAVTQATSTTLTCGAGDIFSFNSGTVQTIPARWGAGGYNHVYVQPGGGSPSKTLGAGALRVNDLLVGDGANAVTLTASANNPVIIATGNVTFANNATYIKTSSSFTFSPSGTKTFTDNNATPQNFGWVKIESGASSPKLNLGSDVAVSSISIAAGHSLDLNGKNLFVNAAPWVNAGSLIAGSTSTVTFIGSSTQTVFNAGQAFANIVSTNISAGGLTFSSSMSATALTLNAAALNSSATMYFLSLSTFTISTFTIIGSANKFVVLKSTAGTPWYLNNTASNNVSYVYVSSCNASQGQTIYCENCVNGGNNTNWNFNTPTVFTWTGAYDNDFEKGLNWDRNAAPRAIDTVIIASTTNKAQLSANVVIASMTVQAGGVLGLNNFNITISSDIILIGTMTASGGEQISVGAGWQVLGGIFNSAGSTVTFNGLGTYSITSGSSPFTNITFNGATGNWTFNDVTISSGTLTIINGTVNIAKSTMTNLIMLGGNLNTFDYVNITGNWDYSAGSLGGWGYFNLNGTGSKTIQCGSVYTQWTINSGTWTMVNDCGSLLQLNGGVLNVGANTFFMAVGNLYGGTLNLQTGDVFVANDWVNSGSQVNAGTSEVDFQSSNGVIRSNGYSFYRANFLSGLSTYTLLDSFSCNTLSVSDVINTGASYAVSVSSTVSNYGTMRLNGSTVTVTGDWQNTGNVISGTSTVVFNNSAVQTLTGSTTFYNIRALTPGATLQFLAGTTQYATNLVEFRKNYLRSTTNNSTWYFTFTGSSQTLSGVRVRDSNASKNGGSVMAADYLSSSLGNNTNWTFAIGPADTGVRYWVAAGTGVWNNSANWALASGYTGGVQVPLSTHTVVFDGGGGKNGNCNINTPVSVRDLIISGSTGIITTQGFSVTVSSSFVQSSGTISLGTSTVFMGGDFSRTGGVFTAGGSTVTFNATDTRTITSASASFYHLVFNGSGGVWNLGDAANTAGSFTVTQGTVSTTASNYGVTVGSDVVINGGTLQLNASSVTVNRNWQFSSGGFNAGLSTVTFVGSLSSKVTSGGSNFAYLGVNKASLVNDVTPQDSLYCTQDLRITNGYLGGSSLLVTVVGNATIESGGGGYTLNSSTIQIGGNASFIVNGGIFGGDSATLVILNGSGNSTLEVGNNPIRNLLVNGTGSWTLASSLYLASPGVLTIANGTIDTGSSQFNNLDVASSVVIIGGRLKLNNTWANVIGNSWINTGGVVETGQSTVTFNTASSGVSGARTIRSAGSSFANLIFNDFASSWTLSDPMSLTGQLTLSSGTVNTNNYFVSVGSGVVIASSTFNLGGSSMTVVGNWKRNVPSSSVFNAGTSVVTFNGTSIQTLSGSSTFYGLRDITSGATLQFTAGTTNYATSIIEFRNVSLLSSSTNATWYFNLSGSSQTIRGVRARDSNASGGSALAADSTSVNGGNNTNWTFGHVAGAPIVSFGNGNWYSTVPDAPWPNGYVPVATDTITISAGNVVTATSTVSLASMTISSSGELDLDGTSQPVTMTVSAGGRLTNNGILRVASSANSVTLQGATGSSFTFTGADIDYNAKKLYLGRVTYQPSMSLTSGETVELSGNATLGPLTTATGSAFIVGNNNLLRLTGDVLMAAGTFTRGTGSSQVKLNGNLSLGTANQNLGDVATGP